MGGAQAGVRCVGAARPARGEAQQSQWLARAAMCRHSGRRVSVMDTGGPLGGTPRGAAPKNGGWQEGQLRRGGRGRAGAGADARPPPACSRQEGCRVGAAAGASGSQCSRHVSTDAWTEEARELGVGTRLWRGKLLQAAAVQHSSTALRRSAAVQCGAASPSPCPPADGGCQRPGA